MGHCNAHNNSTNSSAWRILTRWSVRLLDFHWNVLLRWAKSATNWPTKLPNSLKQTAVEWKSRINTLKWRSKIRDQAKRKYGSGKTGEILGCSRMFLQSTMKNTSRTSSISSAKSYKRNRVNRNFSARSKAGIKAKQCLTYTLIKSLWKAKNKIQTISSCPTKIWIALNLQRKNWSLKWMGDVNLSFHNSKTLWKLKRK